MLGDEEPARDVLQDSFANALRRRQPFRGQGSLEAWMWSTVANAARNAARSRALRRRTTPPLEDEYADGPEDELSGDERRVRELVSGLPERQAFLHYFADLDYASIASALAVRRGTVAATLNAARRALREGLEGAAVSARDTLEGLLEGAYQAPDLDLDSGWSDVLRRAEASGAMAPRAESPGATAPPPQPQGQSFARREGSRRRAWQSQWSFPRDKATIAVLLVLIVLLCGTAAAASTGLLSGPFADFEDRLGGRQGRPAPPAAQRRAAAPQRGEPAAA